MPFDTRVRCTGISTVYQISGIVSSSITPLIGTSLLKANDGQPWYIAGYVFIVAVISAVSTYFIRRSSDLASQKKRAPVAAPEIPGGEGCCDRVALHPMAGDCVEARHWTASPCMLRSRPSRSCSSVTRSPTTMSMTLRMMKLPTPL